LHQPFKDDTFSEEYVRSFATRPVARTRRTGKVRKTMPRNVKSLPENRADCSFGDLVYWHLFERGTRPDGDPSAKIGRIWGLKEASAKIGISDRALRYWLADKHLPDSIAPVERVLFGNSPVFDDWRLELGRGAPQDPARKHR
jgi:hypothetical protein